MLLSVGSGSKCGFSGSQLMTCVLLFESPTRTVDASRYTFGVPGRGQRTGWSFGLSTDALVVYVNL